MYLVQISFWFSICVTGATSSFKAFFASSSLVNKSRRETQSFSVSSTKWIVHNWSKAYCKSGITTLLLNRDFLRLFALISRKKLEYVTTNSTCPPMSSIGTITKISSSVFFEKKQCSSLLFKRSFISRNLRALLF